jgi:hypothetical protein
MAYNEKEMLKDFNGVVIPTQYYDETADVFVLDSSISATAAIISALATEATLTSTAASLDTIKAIDFATETTLTETAAVIDTLAKESTLTATAASLSVIQAIDFATETTLTATAEAIGTTSDTDANTTVIGRLQKLIVDLSALSATKTLADLETAIEGVTDSIVSMQYGGLPVSEMRTDVVSTSSTPAEAKGGATAWSGQRIVHILNQGSVNIEVLTDDEATYGQIVFPGDVYQDVVDGVIYVMSASAGSARVTEKRYVS